MSEDRHPWWENGHGEAYCPSCEGKNKRIAELECEMRQEREDFREAWRLKEQLKDALTDLVRSQYCCDGYRNISVGEDAMSKAKQALQDKP